MPRLTTGWISWRLRHLQRERDAWRNCWDLLGVFTGAFSISMLLYMPQFIVGNNFRILQIVNFDPLFIGRPGDDGDASALNNSRAGNCNFSWNHQCHRSRIMRKQQQCKNSLSTQCSSSTRRAVGNCSPVRHLAKIRCYPDPVEVQRNHVGNIRPWGSQAWLAGNPLPMQVFTWKSVNAWGICQRYV